MTDDAEHGREIITRVEANVKSEMDMLGEIAGYFNAIDSGKTEIERRTLQDAINSLSARIKLVNNALPSLLAQVTIAKRLPARQRETGLESIAFKGKLAEANVTIKKEDRGKFLKELNISEDILGTLKKKKIIKKEEEVSEFKKPRGYLKLANRFFFKTSQELTSKGYFSAFAKEWNKTNINILVNTYIAMILFTTAIAFVVSFLAFIVILAFNFSLTGLTRTFWIPIVMPIATFFLLYLYPSTERGSIGGKIEQELPFAVIQMSAIAGSGIEPSKIFQIIGQSKEYPYLRKEIRKVLNEINIYGYDLVTALNNVSKGTPSTKLAELYAGLSTTISTGGDLRGYFEKRSESLLLSYRLEREKYAKTAETFMDIYISVVIATPMILLLLLVMLSISGINIGFSTDMLGILIIVAVALINIVFLTIMHIKQPSY